MPAKEPPLDDNLLIRAADGADKAKTYQALQDALSAYPQAAVDDRAGFKSLVQGSADRLLSIVYAMVGLAIVVALLGVVNTLALSVVERVHEIGLLRAVGMSRRRLRRMVRLESALTSVFDGLLGVAYGLLWGIRDQQARIGEGMDLLGIPVLAIAAVFAVSLVVGVVAAMVPAFRAGRMNVLGAIAAE